MKRFVLFVILGLSLQSCQTKSEINEQKLQVTLQGEMLFEGANTLQAAAKDYLVKLEESSGVPAKQWTALYIESIEVNFPEEETTKPESLLFQIVSNDQEMVSLGTLSPVPDGQKNYMIPVAAEAPDLLPYFEDKGLTWVLDLNLAADHLDPLKVEGLLSFRIEYQES